ncbi:MAG: thymidine phosphorylase [Armatimonadota bacterium]|nr:thymidine phosphorylase [bacterium]
MRITDIIAAKRDGLDIADQDISKIVLDYAAGDVPDYQMSAFLMACYIRGLSFAEVSAMTRAMIDSGGMLDLSGVSGVKVDKHSTGGVGDKTTLIVVPMLAVCGLKVPKMSGRGLGFTGGTLDKLESIPGFNTAIDPQAFAGQVEDIGAAIAGQSREIVPADKKIYALRDVTATVESIPLIAASIMSKKIACASDVVLLDVKVGSGAFARDIVQARELANTMIAIGANLGKTVGAVVTDMNQPLGCAVGNAIEVAEAIDALKGGGPDDLRRLCVELCAVMLVIAGRCESVSDSRSLAVSCLDSGEALRKFVEIVAAQGGDAGVVEDALLLPQARSRCDVTSLESGFVSEIACARIGAAASLLGAGRRYKEDAVDSAVGIIVKKKLGDRVEKGEVLAQLHVNDESNVSEASNMVSDAYRIGREVAISPLIHEIIRP